MTRAPALVAASHGTSSPDGRAAVAALVDAVRRSAPGLVVKDAFVDVEQPDVASVLAELGSRHEAVVLPLLVSAGHHVHVDLTRDVNGRAEGVALGAALGPDDRLIDVLLERLGEAGLCDDDRVVLAAAGSSDPRAVEDCRVAGRGLAERLGRPVAVGFLSATRPALVDVISRARVAHPLSRVVVSSYLLAPGYFHDLAVAAGAAVTSAPLLRTDAAPPSALVELVLDRYAAAAISRVA